MLVEPKITEPRRTWQGKEWANGFRQEPLGSRKRQGFSNRRRPCFLSPTSPYSISNHSNARELPRYKFDFHLFFTNFEPQQSLIGRSKVYALVGSVGPKARMKRWIFASTWTNQRLHFVCVWPRERLNRIHHKLNFNIKFDNATDSTDVALRLTRPYCIIEFDMH